MGTVAQDKPHTQHAGLHHPCPCGRRLLQGQLPAVRVQRWHRCRDWILLRQPPRRQDPTVTYTANDLTGNVATVEYSGEAVYPPAPAGGYVAAAPVVAHAVH